MADTAKGSGGGSGAGSSVGRSPTALNKARRRTVYDHDMTGAEKFALRSILGAKNACSQLAIAVQSGKPVKAEAVKLCQALQMAAGDMLFA